MRGLAAHPTQVTPLIRRPPAVISAALLSASCAAVLLAVAVELARDAAIGPGALGAVTVLVVLSALLVLAAAAAWRRIDQVLLTVVLGVVTVGATASSTVSVISGTAPPLAAGLALATSTAGLLLLRRTFARLWDPRVSRGWRGSAARRARGSAAGGRRR